VALPALGVTEVSVIMSLITDFNLVYAAIVAVFSVAAMVNR
jgi:hypothetical protein